MPSRKDLANAIRALSMDAVQQANSGHPGMPMGMADMAEVLWNDFLSHNPNNPDWPNRDRFVLSNGHGCMLQYSLLHLTGYDLSIDDIKDFRQLHSKTPGHPEMLDTPGVETTTGPLGQGFANAVGMAIAEKHLAATFNKDEHEVIDHHTYVFMGDGCMMEGISHEAASLAGTLGLGKLIAFWDDNHISIDGETDGWFTDDTPARFRAYHWHVITDVDGHDPDAVKSAIEEAQAETDKPTLICCRTTIGFGAPNKQGTASTHGAPLGEDEVAAARKELGWEHEPFEIPADIQDAFDARTKGEAREAAWQALMQSYETAHPELAKELTRRLEGRLPELWEQESEHYIATAQQLEKAMATRKASGDCLEHLGPMIPELMGGSADLTGSNNTWWSKSNVLTKNNPQGNYIHYGVREFGMFAVMNGMALHGGVRPYGGTFLVFADYGRNAIRLAAITKAPVVFVLTHDSIGLGEDGPTHQPIEHAAMLRATPSVFVWRPADLAETAVAWKFALEHQGPTCLLLTRQSVPGIAREAEQLEHVSKGAYILRDTEGTPDAIIIATGSEVHLALEAAEQLSDMTVRVVSMPCTKRFDAQPKSYREEVLPSNVTARVSVEAGAKDAWYKYVGTQGVVIGLDEFGLSAPYKKIYEDRGITVSAIADAVKSVAKIPVNVE